MTRDLDRIEKVTGRGVVVRGDDIDTDAIIPGRFLKTVTFEDLESHVFADLRRDPEGRPKGHPFDSPRFAGASILVVNRNFGCGSSREHAPQALRRWGIRAIVGESFAEIFFGNCVALGVPCVVVSQEDIAKLMSAVEADPTIDVQVDLETLKVTAGDLQVTGQMPPGPLDAFKEVSPGNHFFGCAHTLANYETAFHECELANTESYENWVDGGQTDSIARANAKWKRVLREYEPPPIDPAVDEALRAFMDERKAAMPDIWH